MSSREGMPVDMMIVDEDAGEGRVPGYENGVGVFVEPFLLKEDMVHMRVQTSVCKSQIR